MEILESILGVIAFAIITGTIIISYFKIRELKQQLYNVEKAFREACGEIHRLQNSEYEDIKRNENR